MTLDMNRKAYVKTEAINADLIELEAEELERIVGGFFDNHPYLDEDQPPPPIHSINNPVGLWWFNGRWWY